MKKLNFLCSLMILNLILILYIPQIGKTTTYYVDGDHLSANNTNPGTLDMPWLTIQHAAETMGAGDTVYIRDSVYNEHVNTEQSGNISEYIVFSAYSGETPIIDGTGVTESQNGFIMDNSYIKLIGLEIRNWNENGIWIENTEHIEITDCVIHDVANGIGMVEGTHDFILNRVEMHHFDLYGFDASPYGADCYNGIFNDCIAHTGRDTNQNVDGFAIGHGTQHNFTFNRCEAYNVYDGFDIGENEGSRQTNIFLNRCSAHDCSNDGYKLTGHGTLVNCLGYNNSNANVGLYWDTNAGTAMLHSCTFMETDVFNVWVENSADSLQMVNCILAGGDNIGLAFEQRNANSYKGNHNLFCNDDPDRAIVVGYEDEFSLNQIESGSWRTYSGQDSNSLIANAVTDLFVDPINFDLHLIKTSIAIDNGTSIGAPSQDYDGNTRPSGDKYDIGAYEYQNSVGIFGHGKENRIPKTFVLLQNHPNPFNASTQINYKIKNKGLPVYVILKIYDTLGKEIITLVDEKKYPDNYSVSWDGHDKLGHQVATGIYFYQMRVENFNQTKKIIFSK